MPPRLVSFAVVSALLLLPTAGRAQRDDPARGRHLRAFESRRELAAYLRTLTPPPYRPPSGIPCDRVFRARRRGIAAGRGAVIAGRLRDTGAGSPIEGAQVFVQGTGIGAVTNASGAFRLQLPADSLGARREYVMTARRIGYQSHERTVRIRAGDSIHVEMTMCASSTTLSTQRIVADHPPAAGAEASASITNVQHAGVDEGGIVKRRGDHLVILRRGRLFTVAIGRGQLEPIASADAFGPGIDPSGTWYDELLVDGDRVVVIGYSYARGGSEVGVFRLDARGGLRHEETYQLRSDDYYSSRNYASRLVGSTLVLYAPLPLRHAGRDPLDALPAMRRWTREGDGGAFRPITSPTRVYRSPDALPPRGGATLHSVSRCDLSRLPMTCEASVVVGPPGRVFYASPTALYVWTSAPHDHRTNAHVFRLPLDGGPATALRVRGGPIDQFSFLESPDAHLNVVVRGDGVGEAMWAAERGESGIALLRVPLALFGDGQTPAPSAAYRTLPSPGPGTLHNRFVGGHVAYGVGNDWGAPSDEGAALLATPWRGGPVTRIPLPHGVDRIEPMGDDAVVVGATGEDLHFSGIRLDGAPRVQQHLMLANAAQGELRSHGFFYNARTGGGTIGLPIRAGGSAGWHHLDRGSAGVAYVRNDGVRFTMLGALGAAPGSDGEDAQADACVASCVDWYGNARPIFTEGRVLALLGYEIVEGREADGRIVELRRASFAPRAVHAVER